MGIIQDGFIFLDNLGVFRILLPFFLIFGIVYGLLQRVKIFGKGDTSNYNAVVAFCLAFFTIWNFSILDSIPILVSRIALLLVIILALLLIGGLLQVNETFKSGLTTFVILLYFIYIVADLYFPNFKISINETLILIVIVLVVFFAIIWFVTKSPNKVESKLVKREDKRAKQEAQEQEREDPVFSEEPSGVLREVPSADDVSVNPVRRRTLDQIRKGR